MGASLAENSYGKSAIRLVTVTRFGPRHELRDLTVSVRLEGNFEGAHVRGDNSAVLPTDTMKNTVFVLARAHASSPIDEFCLAVAARLLDAAPAATQATVEIESHAWDRIRIGERPHDHAFARGSGARRLARVTSSRTGSRFTAGIAGLRLLKSGDSAFSGFLRDQFTTLHDTRDRILATELDARWDYREAPGSFDFAWRSVRDALTETFADHDSESVQHTLYAMAASALQRCDDVEAVHLRMPNQHHLLVDLSPFGIENHNEVFIATEEPFGVIEARVERS